MLSHFWRKLLPSANRELQTILSRGRIWQVRPEAEAILGLEFHLGGTGILPVNGLRKKEFQITNFEHSKNGQDAGAAQIEINIDEWIRTGAAVLVKENLQRTIWRVTLPAGVVYLKRCRANTPRSWAREILRPPKAQLEFENALEILHRGIGCTEPLAWGKAASRWPGETFIITREASDCETLEAFLERPMANERWRELCVSFGQFLARVHRASLFHPDVHPGNFLIRWPVSGKPEFLLLDVHSVQLATMNDNWKVSSGLANLITLNRWFQLRSSRADRYRFWTAYQNEFASADSKKTARFLETETRKSNLVFWSKRLARYKGNNREYKRVRGRDVRGHAVKELPDALLKRWLADPDFAFRDYDARILKDSKSSTVAVLGIDGREYLFKRFRKTGAVTGFKNLVRTSPALRSWLHGQSLRDRGLPTARPLAVAQRIVAGTAREGYLIFVFLHGSVELPDAVAAATPAVLTELAPTLGQLVRDLHDRGVSHRDLKAPNLLIVDGQPVLIDLVGVRLMNSVSDTERIRNLGRLSASFFSSSPIRHADRLRFLQAYLAWSVHSAPDWKSWWKRIAAETTAKIEKNRRSGRVLA